MRTLPLILLLAVVSATPSVPAHAAPPQPLFTLEFEVPLSTGLVAVPAAEREYRITIDPKEIAANPETFLLELPGERPLEAVRTRFVTYRPDWQNWSGTLRPVSSKEALRGTISIGLHGDRVTASIDVSGRRFRLVGVPGDGHRLVALAEDRSPEPCALDGAEDTLAEVDDLELAAEPAPANFTPLATTRLDVLAVYPKAYFGFGGVSEVYLFDFIEDSIALANDVFANSGVTAAYNLVGIVPILAAQPPSTGLFEAMVWLNGQPAEITSLRNAFGADVVTLFIPFIWSSNDYCGIANLPRNNNTFVSATGATTAGVINAAMGDRAFSVHRDGCGLGDFTLGHEVGHNYGMRHHDDPGHPADLEPNGRGFLQAGQFATVMGCYCTGCACDRSCPLGSGAICNRIPYFSDPGKTYLGITIGAANRNNAQVARNRVGGYAAFKAQSANTPPTALFTVSCSGRTCTFNASTSTDNQAIPAGGYFWDFGDGTTGTGKIVNKTYSFGTFFWVHLVVTDSGGQKDVGANTATPS